MTWIIGASSMFGYGVMISDVQITLSDGKKLDILQKAYPLTDSVVAGFAGSVKIGFMLLASLNHSLKLENNQNNHLKIIKSWGIAAKKNYDMAPIEERRLNAKFLIVASSTDEIVEGWPKPWNSKIYIIRFSSPNFTPQIMIKRNMIYSIGSGSFVKKYKSAIHERINLGIYDPILKAETKNPGGWGRTLGFSLSQMVAQYPVDGISNHFHIFTVRRGEVMGSTNDHEIYLPDHTIVNIKMPKVAQGYPEFLDMLNLSQRGKATGATC